MIMINDEDDDYDDDDTYRPNGASMFLYIAVVTPIGQFEQAPKKRGFLTV